MNQARIEQYVSGKLDAGEAEEFEAYCVANPEFAKQVEFEQRLRDGIAQVAQGSTAEFVRSNAEPRWKLAAAASVVRVEIVGLFDSAALYNITLDRIDEQRAHALTTLYGQHPSSPVTLEFMLDAEDLPAGSYTLRVRKQSSDDEPLDFGIVKP